MLSHKRLSEQITLIKLEHQNESTKTAAISTALNMRQGQALPVNGNAFFFVKKNRKFF